MTGHIIVSKFDHHLPRYRQAEMMAAQGVDIDRSTLAGWTGQGAALLDLYKPGLEISGTAG
jgi:transposase